MLAARTVSTTLIALLVLALAPLPAAAATRGSGHRATAKHHRAAAKRARHGAWKRHGQQGIKEDRAREIQTALIREHYLDGQPTGEWDARTQAAMQKFQADNGWQTKVLPDARALIKLGLGPDHSGLLNPETAAIPTSNVPRPAAAIRQ